MNEIFKIVIQFKNLVQNTPNEKSEKIKRICVFVGASATSSPCFNTYSFNYMNEIFKIVIQFKNLVQNIERNLDA